jgi:hypothetical protein
MRNEAKKLKRNEAKWSEKIGPLFSLEHAKTKRNGSCFASFRFEAKKYFMRNWRTLQGNIVPLAPKHRDLIYREGIYGTAADIKSMGHFGTTYCILYNILENWVSIIHIVCLWSWVYSREVDFWFTISYSLQLMVKIILRLKLKRCFSLFSCLPMRKWVFQNKKSLNSVKNFFGNRSIWGSKNP